MVSTATLSGFIIQRMKTSIISLSFWVAHKSYLMIEVVLYVVSLSVLYCVGVCLVILYGAAGGRAVGLGSLIGFAGGILSCWGVLGVGCSVLYCTVLYYDCRKA